MNDVIHYHPGQLLEGFDNGRWRPCIVEKDATYYSRTGSLITAGAYILWQDVQVPSYDPWLMPSAGGWLASNCLRQRR